MDTGKVKMRVLTFTSLFPNPGNRERGIFVKRREEELAKLCELRAVIPIRWRARLNGAWSRGTKRPKVEGEPWVSYARFFVFPKYLKFLDGLLMFLSTFRKIKRLSREFNFDLVNAHWAYPDGFAAYLVAKALRKPISVTVHGSDINLFTKYWLRKKIISFYLKRVDRIIAVSNFMKSKLVDLGIPTSKVAVIPNGVDLELFKPLPQDERDGKKRVLFVGGLLPVKGADILIKAVGRLVKDGMRDLHLTVVGKGPEEKRLRSLTRKLGLEKNVTFAGRRPAEEIPLWMNEADIICVPSWSEGWSCVAMEALACGRPVVASAAGGPEEIIRDEKYGFLVPPGKVEDLAEAIKKALEKDWDRDSLTCYGRQRGWQEVAWRVHEEFKATLEGRRGEN